MCYILFWSPDPSSRELISPRQLGSDSVLLEGCRLLEMRMGTGAARRRPLKGDKRVQEQGDVSHPVNSPSNWSLMIVVSDPTSRLRLL